MSRLVLTLLLLAFCQSVSAATITVDPGSGGGPALIRLTGPIVAEDFATFQGIADGHNSAFVVLDSHGGSVFAALKIGSLIREKHFTTLVSNSLCTSSCALIWLAGTPRYMALNAQIGFHAAYLVKENGDKETTGYGNAMIGAYLTKLGLSDQAIYYVTAATPDDVTWLTYNEAASKGIPVRLFPTNPALAATQPEQPAVHAPPPSSPVQNGNEHLVEIVARTFKQNYAANGISGIIAATQGCYQHSETTTESARVCMLYDTVGFEVDRGYTQALGNPSLRQPYYADQAFDARIKHYAGAVFGGWNAQARDFLALSKQIVTQLAQ